LQSKHQSGVRKFPVSVREGPFMIRRFGRLLLWSRPSLYRWLGIIRGHGDCHGNGFDMWIGGYPRSANTFAAASFTLANPSVKLASHFHIPAFIIRGLQCEKPGIFLIRQPEDCVVSWTIYWEGRMKLEDSLDYYIDFHRSMNPYMKQLFVAPFEETTTNFGNLIREFNSRFGTLYAALPMDHAVQKRCLSYVEDFFRSDDGSVNELKVSRPSVKRETIKRKHLASLRNSPRLSRKLETARNLYTLFHQNSIRLPHKPSLEMRERRQEAQEPLKEV
jgi:hypothetical protein